MRNIPSTLQAHLDSGATTVCHCWRLTTRSGRQLGFTDHDLLLEFEGSRFDPETGFAGTAIEASLGLAAGSQDVAGALRAGTLDEAELAAGVFDDAMVEVWLVNWQNPDERLLLRTGNLGEVTRGSLGFTAEVRGLADRLDQPQGRLFQPMCDAQLGDARCGVDAADASYSSTATVQASEGSRRFVVSGLEAYEQGWFERGEVTFISGANSGERSNVSSHMAYAGTVTLELEMRAAHPVQPGDQLKVVAGCNKQFSTCRTKFSNAVNFRGFPHMPGNDFLTYYPVPGEAASDD